MPKKNTREDNVEQDNLWTWFWYRLLGGQGFPWFEFSVAALVGAALVGLGVLVVHIITH